MNLDFLEAELSHCNLLSAIDGECFDSEVFSKDMLGSLLSTPYVFGLILTLDETAIGYALISLAGAQGDLLTISILPKYQGNGFGRLLLKEIIKQAGEKGLKEMFLEVRPSNKKAISLYESFLGVKEGIRKNYYIDELSGKAEDALVMKLPI